MCVHYEQTHFFIIRVKVILGKNFIKFFNQMDFLTDDIECSFKGQQGFFFLILSFF